MSPTGAGRRAASSISISRARKAARRHAAIYGGRIFAALAAALQKGGDDAARQLFTLVAADFDRSSCNKRKLAAWCAFWGEAKSRPTYQALCGARDEAYQNVFIELCRVLKTEGDYGFEPHATALALSATLEGLWLRLMMGTEDVTRETALKAATEFLASVFPKHYAREATGIRVLA